MYAKENNTSKRSKLPMKKLLSILLLCLFASGALAGGDCYYYPYSVANSKTSAANYAQFNQAGELSILIPGVDQDFVPQGIAYYADQNLMIFSGYSSSKPQASSALIAVNMQTNEIVKEIFLQDVNGQYLKGHFGGVCVTDKNVFISSDNCLYRLPLSAFNAAPVSSSLQIAEAIPVPCNASFCQIDSNGILWVGEFEHGSAYPTDKSHYTNTIDGKNKAWLLGYQLNASTDNELTPGSITAAGAIPDYIVSINDRIQGVTFCDGQIYLSQSFGRDKTSTIYRHDNVLADAPDKQVNVLGAQRPLWILDSDSQNAALSCPPMTEGLCTIGGSVYVSFESAASTYREPSDPKDGTSVDPIDRLFKLNPTAF